MEEKISMIKEQMSDILESMADVQFFEIEYYEKENEFSGNPEGVTEFRATINHIPYKDKTFTWQKASETENGYVNRIKAYLFDVLDGVANL